jgi:hypothetical protein
MPAERTIMRRVREVLRLKFVGGVPTRARVRRFALRFYTDRTSSSTGLSIIEGSPRGMRSSAPTSSPW